MIVLYKGARGKGKTLTMVKDAYKFYIDGYRIMANFKIKFGDYISPRELMALNKESKLRDVILVLDELQIFFDSRNFGRAENKEFSYFIQQIRKRNIHILGTAQYSNTVELRFRQHIDVVAYPHYDSECNMCKVYYFDISRFEDDLEQIKIDPIMVVYPVKQIFGLYDTNEMLK